MSIRQHLNDTNKAKDTKRLYHGFERRAGIISEVTMSEEKLSERSQCVWRRYQDCFHQVTRLFKQFFFSKHIKSENSVPILSFYFKIHLSMY